MHFSHLSKNRTKTRTIIRHVAWIVAFPAVEVLVFEFHTFLNENSYVPKYIKFPTHPSV